MADRTTPLLPDDAVLGPVVRPANRSRNAAGSIHDDSTAQAAGFAGGTVAGNVHLDHVPPLAVETFGQSWFERGWVSMYFKAPTTHLEPVRFAHAPVASDAADAWFATPEGAIFAEGAIGLGEHPAPSPLRARDKRPTPLDELDLLADVPFEKVIEAGATSVNMDRQHALLGDPELLPLPLDWYRDVSPWGPAIACPSVAVDTLWSGFERAIRPHVKPAVGLYGAIELHHRNGPLLAGVDYELNGMVTAVSQSPRTEIFWAETTAAHDDTPIASLVMMIRLLR